LQSLWLFPVIRDRSYFWHYFVSGGHIDFGLAADGADISPTKLFPNWPGGFFALGWAGFIIQVTPAS